MDAESRSATRDRTGGRRCRRGLLALGLLLAVADVAAASGDERLVREAIGRVDAGRIIARIEHLQAYGSRHSYAPGTAQVAEWIAGQFRAWGYEVRLEPVPWLGQEWLNVIATRRGTRTPERLYVLGTHYDSQAGARFAAEAVAPGADDNASGTAGVLEAAEVLAPYEFASSVRFIAFAGEEQLLRGSFVHVSRLPEETEHRVEAAIVLEMIGFTGPEQKPVPGCPEPAGAGDFLGVLGNEPSAALVSGFLETAAQHVPELPLESCINELVARSDHFPFWLAGYQALLLTDTANFRNPYYHTVEDTVDKLDAQFAARSTRSAVAFLSELAGIEPAPALALYGRDAAGLGVLALGALALAASGSRRLRGRRR